MMNAIFYKNTTENNRVYKNNYLQQWQDLDIILKEECSLTNPVLTVQISGLIEANYVYIPDFNRYYFITNIVSIRMSVWEVYLHIDVLMSFKDKFMGLSAAVNRNEFKYNARLVDDYLPVEYVPTKQIVETINIGIDFANAPYPDNSFYIAVTVVNSDGVTFSTTPTGITNGVLTIPNGGLYPQNFTCGTYVMSSSLFKEFVNKVFTDSTKIQYILNCFVVPTFYFGNGTQTLLKLVKVAILYQEML